MTEQTKQVPPFMGMPNKNPPPAMAKLNLKGITPQQDDEEMKYEMPKQQAEIKKPGGLGGFSLDLSKATRAQEDNR